MDKTYDYADGILEIVTGIGALIWTGARQTFKLEDGEWKDVRAIKIGDALHPSQVFNGIFWLPNTKDKTVKLFVLTTVMDEFMVFITKGNVVWGLDDAHDECLNDVATQLYDEYLKSENGGLCLAPLGSDEDDE